VARGIGALASRRGCLRESAWQTARQRHSARRRRRHQNNVIASRLARRSRHARIALLRRTRVSKTKT
jgi:hypothetical protein